MPTRLSWSKLVPGLIGLLVVVSATVAVLVFAGVGRIRGKTLRLYFVAKHARGLIQGSDVWLAGQKVGVIERMDFLAPSADTGARLVLVADVKASDAEQIRRDSKVRIRTGGSIVGPIVLWITPGGATSPRAADGDTLRAEMASELELAGSQLAGAADQLPPLLADARTAFARARDTAGTFGAMMNDRGLKAEVARLRAQWSRLQPSASPHPSPRAQFMASARVALARADSIRALIATPTGNVGRFRRDSSLARAVARVRDDLAQLNAQLDSSTGSLERFGADSAITLSLIDARRELTLLLDDIRRRPVRYITF